MNQLEAKLLQRNNTDDVKDTANWKNGCWGFCDALINIVAGFVFWYGVLFVHWSSEAFYIFLAVVASLMIAWRIVRVHYATGKDTPHAGDLPYSSAFVSIGGKELFVVGTMHISPRSPIDVERVISSTRPDISMIELDKERLARMRAATNNQKAEQKDFRPLKLKSNDESTTVYTQEALWNADHPDDRLSGRVVFDDGNPNGLKPLCDACRGNIVLVHRSESIALLAHNFAQYNVTALLVINNEAKMPAQRISAGSLWEECRVAFATRKCSPPTTPVLVLTPEDGETLKVMCSLENSAVHATFQVNHDDYPRRTLPRRLCMECAMCFSGVGVLYGIMRFLSVKVGAEFLKAEDVSGEHGIPCFCVDVDMNKFCNRLAQSLCPTPRNLCHVLCFWFAFPRFLFSIVFPPRDNVDVPGSIVLHMMSLSWKTCAAFAFAIACANMVLLLVLETSITVTEEGAEAAGAVLHKYRDTAQGWINILLKLYLFPQLYDAVAVSRDEAMYRGIVATGQENKARRMVVVVGAAHANGILKRARTRGL